MEETTNESGMSMGMVVGIVVIVALVVGAGVYSYANNKAAKEKQDLNAQSPELQSQVSSAKDDTSLLTTLCQSNNSGLTCAVGKIEGNFATGTSSDTNEGSHWYAKKVNGTWTMAQNGLQDDPSCSKTSDFPKSIVPTCANN